MDGSGSALVFRHGRDFRQLLRHFPYPDCGRDRAQQNRAVFHAGVQLAAGRRTDGNAADLVRAGGFCRGVVRYQTRTVGKSHPAVGGGSAQRVLRRGGVRFPSPVGKGGGQRGFHHPVLLGIFLRRLRPVHRGRLPCHESGATASLNRRRRLRGNRAVRHHLGVPVGGTPAGGGVRLFRHHLFGDSRIRGVRTNPGRLEFPRFCRNHRDGGGAEPAQNEMNTPHAALNFDKFRTDLV